MKIGIYGGTFDPFHRGHLEPVLAARGKMQWDEVWYVPAYVQPFKQDRTFASPYHRFAMIAASIVDHDFIYVSSIELERGHVSYTVETLEELRAKHSGDTLDWIIGDDNFLKLHEWKSLDRIFELANFAVLTRRSHEVPPAFASRVCDAESRSTHGSISFSNNPTLEISSTDVRDRVREGQPIDDLVPPPVSRYIQHYGLYRKGQS
ncbi:MAG TPA: nicotinate-nucleotide adenylyltransferase [Thermoanaerobaculia bacterium]|nr:nicotinate-nucleotide adenylyltransferase [Thermoanaerobaculia bacterium]